MVEVVIEEMFGVGLKPIARLQTSRGRRCREERKNEREKLF
jgi:hypothetical protein